MTISVVLTVQERKREDLWRVFDSLRDQVHDSMVLVIDRTPTELLRGMRDYWQDDPRVNCVLLDGDPGWRSPVAAYNAGLSAVVTDLLYFISSDTVQEPGNVARARSLLEADDNIVVHGKAECSCGPQGQEVNWGGQAPGNLLCDAAHPRPLGFIWAMHARYLKHGLMYDEAFSEGLWHDDTDFMLRLWNRGLDFVFDDSIAGTHLHHARPGLEGQEAAEKIARNAALMLRKHGTTYPWPTLPRINILDQGRTEWRHL